MPQRGQERRDSLADPGRCLGDHRPPLGEPRHDVVAQEPLGALEVGLVFGVVNVDVYVTDAKGNRVTDLTAADFEVLEDGRPVEITNFYLVEDRNYRRGTPRAEARPERPADEASTPAAPPLPLIELEQVDDVPRPLRRQRR